MIETNANVPTSPTSVGLQPPLLRGSNTTNVSHVNRAIWESQIKTISFFDNLLLQTPQHLWSRRQVMKELVITVPNPAAMRYVPLLSLHPCMASVKGKISATGSSE